MNASPNNMIDIMQGNRKKNKTTALFCPIAARIEKVFLIVGWLIFRLSNYLIFMS